MSARHAARCEARGARNLVCGLSRRRQAQARSHCAAPPFRLMSKNRSCTRTIFFFFLSFFLILFFLFFKEPRFQGSFIRYCTKSATFPHTLYGAPVNAWRCRPRLAGAQGAQYANTLALSCHTRGVLRGHHDTMPCPTSLPSGARRCWAPLLAWPSGRTCGSSCALTSGASGVVHVQALGIPQAPSRTADPCRLRLARVACTFALFLPPLPRRTRADTREHVCIDRTSQH